MSPKKPVAEDAVFQAAELDRLFLPFKRFSKLGLAVSGGSDSTALMRLAARWRGATKFVVLTVDHGLRPESEREGLAVAEWSSGLGLTTNILKWTGAKPTASLQAKAREARYRLMAEWCAAQHADGVVTAHTVDDQAETFMMRLARGSGVDGLSAMQPETTIYGLRILRPLLEVSRERLRDYLKREGQPYFEDPSNSNAAFERIRIRQAMDVVAQAGLHAKAVAQSAKRVSRVRDALERATDGLEAESVSFRSEGHAIVEGRIFKAAPEELRLRLIARVISKTGGVTPAPELSEIEQLGDWLASGKGRARTLGGCRVQRRERSLVFARESGRIAAKAMTIRAGETLLWDGRYKIRLEGAGREVWTVLALGQAKDRALVERPVNLPDFVFKTLPTLVVRGRIALVPQIGYRRPGLGNTAKATVTAFVRS